jgi:hypothetical protein
VRLLVVALSLCAVTVAGCGGQSKQASYRKDFQPLNRSLVQLGRQVGGALQTSRGKSDEQIRREFGSYAARLDKIQGDFDGLDPPGKLAGEQDSLVRAIGRVKSALRGIELAAAKKNFNAARRATIRLVLSSVGLKRTRERLTRDLGKGG